MKLRTVLIIGGVALAGGAAYYYYDKQINLLKEIEYKIVAFKIISISFEQTKIVLTFRIFSKSRIEAQIKGLYIEIFINDQKIGAIEDGDVIIDDKNIGIIKADKPFIIPALGYSDVPIQLTVSPKLLTANALKLLTGFVNTQDLKINLVGFVRLKSAFISVSVPFAYDTTLKEILTPSTPIV